MSDRPKVLLSLVRPPTHPELIAAIRKDYNARSERNERMRRAILGAALHLPQQS